MKNKIGQIQIVKNKSTRETLGYILPGDSVMVSREYLENSTHREVPSETPVNTVEV